MAPDDTPALEDVAGRGLDHVVVRYGRAESVEEAARLRDVELHQVIKTLVVRRGDDDFVFVLVPGDRQIDWPKLRRHLEVSRLSLASRDEALAATGYRPGTITPFGSTRSWPVVMDASMDGLVSIGGGDHGVAVNLDADAARGALDAAVADVTRSSSDD